MSTRSARRRAVKERVLCWCGRLMAARRVWRSRDGRYEMGGLAACVDHLRTDRWPQRVQDELQRAAEALNEVARASCPLCQGEGVHVH